MSTAQSDAPVDTGVPTIVIAPPELVWIVVYHISVTPVESGCENLAPVAVCSRAQNGSVPRAKNGVNVTSGRGGGTSAPVTVVDAAGTTGTVALFDDWNNPLQLVMKPRVSIAGMMIIFI